MNTKSFIVVPYLLLLFIYLFTFVDDTVINQVNADVYNFENSEQPEVSKRIMLSYKNKASTGIFLIISYCK